MTKTIKIGEVGVDSGYLLICDPSYLSNEIPDYKKLVGTHKSERVYGTFGESKNCCSPFQSLFKSYQVAYKQGHDGAGVVFESGYGDGYYSVYAVVADEGKFGVFIKEIRINFFEGPTRKRIRQRVGD